MSVDSPPHAAAAAAAAGDPAARALHWLDDHGDALYRYAVARTGDPTAAEDLVQETLLAAMRARFDGGSTERTWLVGILRHKVADHRRRRSSREHTFTDGDGGEDHGGFDAFTKRGRWTVGVPGWRSDPTAGAELSEFRDVLARCMSKLPRRVATLFWLREAEDRPTEELCAELGISPSNLWTMLYRARSRLRQCLTLNWFGGGGGGGHRRVEKERRL
jgi:RNA polymerase sigma-70 factor (ECF subfamily)